MGGFKSFPVAADDHFLSAGRYVERNALRAGLVTRAEDWPWGSAWLRHHDPQGAAALLSSWPVTRPDTWDDFVNAAQTEAELQALRQCVQRGRPFGSTDWVQRSAARLGLEQTLRPAAEAVQR